MKAAPILDCINRFFRGDGPPRLIFFYSSNRDVDSPESGLADGGTGGHSITVSDGHDLPLAERAVFFVKTTVGTEDKPAAALDPMAGNDGALSFGVINSPLESFEGLIRRLYKPLLSSQTLREWGKAETDHQNEFMISLDSLVQNLQESLKSLHSGLELCKPDKSIEAQALASENAASDPTVVAHFIELLEDWCMKVEAYLDDSDRSRWETNDSGPDTELEYWRRRMQRLTNITDQLKTRQCKTVIAVLTTVTKQVCTAATATMTAATTATW